MIELVCYPDDDFIDGTLIDIKFALVWYGVCVRVCGKRKEGRLLNGGACVRC